MTVTDFPAKTARPAREVGVDRRSAPDQAQRGPDRWSPADLAEVDRLIRDLGALVEAGLVVVEPSRLGPARYAPAGPQLDDAA